VRVERRELSQKENNPKSKVQKSKVKKREKKEMASISILHPPSSLFPPP